MAQQQPPRQIEATRRYETPTIELILTPEALEREVQYAGLPSEK